MLSNKRSLFITEPVDRVTASGGNGKTFVAEMKRVAKLISQTRLHESSITGGFVTHRPSPAFFVMKPRRS